MKVITLEVRMRLNEQNQDEAKASLDARYKLMNIPGALSVVQIGNIDNPSQAQEVPVV